MEEYTKIKAIGKGAMGVAWLVERKADGVQVWLSHLCLQLSFEIVPDLCPYSCIIQGVYSCFPLPMQEASRLSA
jgi:hypothetical protein